VNNQINFSSINCGKHETQQVKKKKKELLQKKLRKNKDFLLLVTAGPHWTT
jgi:hypothetical protein